MHIELTKQRAKCLVLLQRHVLITKEDHLMTHERIMDFLELLITQVTTQVDARDHCANPRRYRLDSNGLIIRHLGALDLQLYGHDRSCGQSGPAGHILRIFGSQ